MKYETIWNRQFFRHQKAIDQGNPKFETLHKKTINCSENHKFEIMHMNKAFKRRKKRIKSLLTCILCLALVQPLLCGYTFFREVATLEVNDKKENYIYRICDIDDIHSELTTNKNKAVEAYNGRRCVFTGKIDLILENNMEFTLTSQKNVRVDARVIDPQLAMKIGDLQVGDTVKIYGRLMIDIMFGNAISVDVEEINTTALSVDTSADYEFISGKKYNNSLTTARTLGAGRMKYHIPNEWSSVESKLEGIEGYQYKLNEISSTYKTEPEQVYLFYFSNEKYLNNQSDKGETKSIEMAIIKNILKGENVSYFSIKTMTSDYGRIYQYYDSNSFVDQQKKGHNVEFVFTPAGSDGIACIMYVYNESHHKEDILYVMREMEV